MICPNCSAEFDERQIIVCPYCGYESMEGAATEHRQEIREIKRRTNDMKKRPDRMVQKSTRVLFKSAAVLLAIFVVVLLILFLHNKWNTPERAVENQERQLQRFEEIYQSGDYGKLWEEIYEFEESYSATYRKYYNVGSLYDRFLWIDESNYYNAYYASRISEAMSSEEVLEEMQYSFSVLAEAKEYKDAGYVYGEEEAVEQIAEDMRASMRLYYCLTDEELAELFECYLVWGADTVETDTMEAEAARERMLVVLEPIPGRMLNNEVEERKFD